MHKVYLAGPMTGLSWQQALEWRKQAEDFFNFYAQDIRTLSPLRWDHRHPDERAIDYGGDTSEVMRRDFFDVQQSDIVLANFEICAETNVSFGTVSEIAWAYALRKPTVMVCPEGKLYHHPWMIEMADYVRSDLVTGMELVRQLLG